MSTEHQGMTLEDAEEMLELAKYSEVCARLRAVDYFGSIESAVWTPDCSDQAKDVLKNLGMKTRIRTEFEEMVKRKTREAAIGEQRCD